MDTKDRHLGEVVPTADGSLTLRHPEHGECYHSTTGAAGEAQDLYIDASGIGARWLGRREVSVLDVGLGLGYNAIATIRSWQVATNPPSLFIQSLEIDPLLVERLASGVAPWQSTWLTGDLMTAQCLRQTERGWVATLHHPRAGSVCDWEVTVGDAHVASLSPPEPGFHFVWQDPFSPQKNPAMWEPDWFARALACAAPDAVLMTYSVARSVRDALSTAGWVPEKIPTPDGVKKHWLRATIGRG